MVEWRANGMNVYGAILENKQKSVIVFTHKVDGRIKNQQVEVNKNLIKLMIN